MAEQVLDRTAAPTSRLMTAVCLILGVIAWSRLGADYLRMLRPGPQVSPDFYQEWCSARSFRMGLPVYTPHAVSIPIHLHRPQADREKDIEYNAHPPASVVLALPFSGLELPDAVLAWNLVTLSGLMVGLILMAANLPELRSLFLPAALFLPLCLPIYGVLQQGQLTFVLLLLVVAAWSEDRRGRSTVAGLMVGMAAAVKLFPAFLVVYFAARGRWRAVLAAASAFAAVNLGAAAVLGWGAYRDYLVTVLPSLGKFRSYGFNLSFGGFWHKLFDPASERGWIVPLWYCPTLARAGTIASDLVATAVVARASYRARDREQGDVAFALATTAMLLVSPITWDYSLPLLLVPLAVAIRAAATRRWMAAALVPVVVVFGVPQMQMMEVLLAGGPPRVASPAFVLGALSLSFYALLGLFAALAALERRPHGQPDGTGLQ